MVAFTSWSLDRKMVECVDSNVPKRDKGKHETKIKTSTNHLTMLSKDHCKVELQTDETMKVEVVLEYY